LRLSEKDINTLAIVNIVLVIISLKRRNKKKAQNITPTRFLFIPCHSYHNLVPPLTIFLKALLPFTHISTSNYVPV
jgi:hypothetical protein